MRRLICKVFGHKKPYFHGFTAVGPAMFCRRCRLSVYLCDDWWKRTVTGRKA